MTLKRGAKGPEVKVLQEKLGVPGANGNFGPLTQAKLKEWQTANGLTPDGIAGPDILEKLGVSRPTAPIVESPSVGFKLEKLKGHVPDAVIAQIPDTAAKFGITNVLRLAHLLGQCAHESGNFKAVRENLNYSANGLKKNFGKYFPGALNESYARNPEKIANRVYGNRMGNGDEASGDGFRFSGAGFIQLTGKNNFREFSKYIGEDCVANPELVAIKYPLASAAFFFNSNKLWTLCDKGVDSASITKVTKRVNGGTHGLDDRIQKTTKFYNLLK